MKQKKLKKEDIHQVLFVYRLPTHLGVTIYNVALGSRISLSWFVSELHGKGDYTQHPEPNEMGEIV